MQINAYLSPSSARGLDVHFDYHDVFVVQLEGTKRWRVWAPTERSRDPIGGKHAVPRPTLEELGEPILDLVLEPGDVLYLPRGHPHVAETTDRASAHLTVGVLAITWHRVVRRAIDDEIAAGRLRSSIPLVDPRSDPPPGRIRPARARTAPDLGGLPSTSARSPCAAGSPTRSGAARPPPGSGPAGPLDPAAADGRWRSPPAR